MQTAARAQDTFDEMWGYEFYDVHCAKEFKKTWHFVESTSLHGRHPHLFSFHWTQDRKLDRDQRFVQLGQKKRDILRLRENDNEEETAQKLYTELQRLRDGPKLKEWLQRNVVQ